MPLALGAQLMMISAMMQRKYKFNVGDICWILEGPKAYTLTVIKYPSFFPRYGFQTYVTTASFDDDDLYMECNLELLFKYKDGDAATKRFLDRTLALVNSRLDQSASQLFKNRG